uniref:Uncharacterized protein n=1 Tax=Zea mays TaxID=4577 RepID=C0HIV9_MAIZE|nr:unknown [Zea mays]
MFKQQTTCDPKYYSLIDQALDDLIWYIVEINLSFVQTSKSLPSCKISYNNRPNS